MTKTIMYVPVQFSSAVFPAAVIIGCLIALPSVGCKRSESTSTPSDVISEPADPENRLQVFVVNHPLQYFAERIGGDSVQVSFPVPETQDPAYWEPSGDQIAEIQSFDLVLLNGADYAKWTLRATLPWSRTVVTTEDLEDALIEIPDAVVHSHGPEGEHSHAGIVSETWLDPDLAIRQARVVCDALSELTPDHKSNFENRFDELRIDLLALAEDLDATLAPTSIRWLSDKPKFHYLLARYKATSEVMHWEAENEISATEWESLQERLDGDTAIMLWSYAPLATTRDRLLAQGVRCVVIDTTARTPPSGDYLSTMSDNIRAIRSALASAPKSAPADE